LKKQKERHSNTYSLRNGDVRKETSLARKAPPTHRRLILEATQPPPALPIKPPDSYKHHKPIIQGSKNSQKIILTFIGGPENSSSIISNTPLSATTTKSIRTNQSIKKFDTQKTNVKFHKVHVNSEDGFEIRRLGKGKLVSG
jgi:hypothetical protein